MKNETDVIKIRIDLDVKTELEKIAEYEQRTLAGQIRLALGQWIENQEGRAGHCGMPRYSKQQPQPKMRVS
jgi:hypothetical protein